LMTLRNAPLWDRTVSDILLIWGKREAEYFCKWGWTGFTDLPVRQSVRSPDATNGSRECAPDLTRWSRNMPKEPAPPPPLTADDVAEKIADALPGVATVIHEVSDMPELPTMSASGGRTDFPFRWGHFRI